MKKKMVLSAVVFLLCLSGCGNRTQTGESLDSDSILQSASEDAETSASSDEDEVQESNANDDTTYYDWNNVAFYYPASYKMDIINSTTVFTGQSKSGEPIYYLVKANTSYEDSAEITSVPDILKPFLFEAISYHVPTYESNFDITTDTEESCEIQGFSFIKRCGIVKTETNTEKAELAYAAYYGIVDFPAINRYDIPVVWMACSETGNSETISELKELADKSAELLSWE